MFSSLTRHPAVLPMYPAVSTQRLAISVSDFSLSPQKRLAGPSECASLFELFPAFDNSGFRCRFRLRLGIDMNRGRRTDGETNPVVGGIFDGHIDYFSRRRSQPQ